MAAVADFPSMLQLSRGIVYDHGSLLTPDYPGPKEHMHTWQKAQTSAHLSLPDYRAHRIDVCIARYVHML